MSNEVSLAGRVSSKLEEGDFSVAVRLASTDVSLAPMNEATYEVLLERHPPAHSDFSTLPMEVGQHCFLLLRGMFYWQFDGSQAVRQDGRMASDHRHAS